MRIAYVTAARIPSYAANGVQVVRMCEAFVEKGNSVILVSKEAEEEFAEVSLSEFYGLNTEFSHLSLKVPDNRKGHRGLQLLRILRILRRLSPDLVYTRSLGVAHATVRLGYRTILELHSLKSTPRKGEAAFFGSLCSSRNLVRVVVISDALRKDLECEIPSARGCCVVAHDAAVEPGRDVQTLRIRRGNRRPIVGYVGGLYPGKGFEIIHKCAERMPDFDFHVAGRASGSDIVDLSRFGEMDNLIMHGFLPPVSTESFRAACDILLAPYQDSVSVAGGGGDVSRWMSPLKIFESMASKKPIICSDLPVIREVLVHGKSALLCRPDDIDAWCRAIELLAVDSDLRERLIDNAFKRFIGQHTYSVRAQTVLQGLG